MEDIAVIGAMDVEVDEFASTLLDTQKRVYGGVEFIVGRRATKTVVVCKCGVGKVNAAVATTLLLTHFPAVKVVINIGVAGGVKAGIRQCDFVVSDKTVHHDFDSTADGRVAGQVPDNDFVFFESDKACGDKLMRIMGGMGLTAYKGVIGSGDQFVADKARADFIVKTFDAYAVDMESAAINHVCYIFRKPFVALRCISDNADGDGVKSFYEFLDEATRKTAQVIGAYVDTAE